MKNLKKLNSLSIKGKKLIDVEYDRELNSDNKKILHSSKRERYYFLTERLE